MQPITVNLVPAALPTMEARRSKRKSGKSPEAQARSVMLKAIMPKLSGDRGQKLAKAFVDGDKETIRKELTDITNELSE